MRSSLSRVCVRETCLRPWHETGQKRGLRCSGGVVLSNSWSAYTTAKAGLTARSWSLHSVPDLQDIPCYCRYTTTHSFRWSGSVSAGPRHCIHNVDPALPPPPSGLCRFCGGHDDDDDDDNGEDPSTRSWRALNKQKPRQPVPSPTKSPARTRWPCG